MNVLRVDEHFTFENVNILRTILKWNVLHVSVVNFDVFHVEREVLNSHLVVDTLAVNHPSEVAVRHFGHTDRKGLGDSARLLLLVLLIVGGFAKMGVVIVCGLSVFFYLLDSYSDLYQTEHREWLLEVGFPDFVPHLVHFADYQLLFSHAKSAFDVNFVCLKVLIAKWIEGG